MTNTESSVAVRNSSTALQSRKVTYYLLIAGVGLLLTLGYSMSRSAYLGRTNSRGSLFSIESLYPKPGPIISEPSPPSAMVPHDPQVAESSALNSANADYAEKIQTLMSQSNPARVSQALTKIPPALQAKLSQSQSGYMEKIQMLAEKQLDRLNARLSEAHGNPASLDVESITAEAQELERLTVLQQAAMNEVLREFYQYLESALK